MRRKLSIAAVGGVVVVTAAVLLARGSPTREAPPAAAEPAPKAAAPRWAPRKTVDPSGFNTLMRLLPRWADGTNLEQVAATFDRAGYRLIEGSSLDAPPATGRPDADWVKRQLMKAALLNYEGDVAKAEEVLVALRAAVEPEGELAREWLATIAYLQGVTALRRGENENCVNCLGASACILPIAREAVHGNPAGSRGAVRHFTEILEAAAPEAPDDMEVKWLLNLAHMTLGEWPQGVDPRYRLPLERFFAAQPGFPRLENVAPRVGLDRLSESGGAIFEDFDGDGLLDVALSTFEPSVGMAVYRNRGDGTFEDRSEAAGVKGQTGALYCVQTDFDNDGLADIFLCRGAWLLHPIRPSLLRNRGDGAFEDVTAKAGLAEPVNSNSACWADYDNDGLLDVFVCCEQQPNKLYRNLGGGKFKDMAALANVAGGGPMVKGACWTDFDNDGWPDLFVNILSGKARLYHNRKNGTFHNVTGPMGVNGPRSGFSCWTFDYDNDGWLDIFATCYERTVGDVVKGMMGEPHANDRCRLYRNLGGQGFEDRSREAGLDGAYATMGSNFGDFDGDGFLDIYLGTGDPSLSTLVPNRMFRNDGGKRFEDVTSASGTGHLQKGHGVSCGDWDRDGDIDLLAQLGGALPGDRFHTVLFQNPGSPEAWISVKLVGVKTNRAAIGARIKVEADGLTVHRLVSSGSSFGANPLEQTIVLGRARRIAALEVRWPTSGTTQVFRDVPLKQRIEVTEFAEAWRPAPAPRVELPR